MGFFRSVLNVARGYIQVHPIHFSMSIEETGYRTMKNRDRLIEVICETYDRVWRGDKEYAPKDGVTYCNMAAADVAGALGCNDLRDKLANEIVTMMETSPDWSPIPMDQAQELANQGSLLFAVARADPHGHICVIRPGMSEFSPKWGTHAPACMNVGGECFIGRGVNWAFREPPKFYVWKKSL